MFRPARGFTLIEVTLAILLFALLLAGTYGSIRTAVRSIASGEVERVTQPDGSYVEYGYDAAHRLTEVRDNLGSIKGEIALQPNREAFR